MQWLEMKASKVGQRLAKLFLSRFSSNLWAEAKVSGILEPFNGPIQLGCGTKIAESAVLSTVYGGGIVLGERCEIHRGALIMSYGGWITLGDDCSVNPYSILYGHGGLTIGNGVRIAAHTVIIPANHEFDDISRPIYQQPLSKEGIVIEDDVWIGAGVKILDGVIIRRGSVIGAGAVVTREVPAFTVNVGVPCHVIADRRTSSE